MTGYICIAMLEDPPYNLIVAAITGEPKDWCAKLPLPSHLLCFDAFNNPDIIFKQFIQVLKANGITVKTDRAFPAQPHEVIRAFNQIRDEAFNNRQAIKEVIDVEKREQSHGLAKDINKEILVTPLHNAKNDVLKTLLGLLELIVLKETGVVETEYKMALTATGLISTPLLATQQWFSKFTVQDGTAKDIETDLMWLRFAHGQTWQNGTVLGNATNVSWNKAFEIVRQFNQQDGYTGHSDWRLPTIVELKSLVCRVKSKSNNTIDTDVFPNNAQRFWSSTPGTGGVRIMYFNYGDGVIGSRDCNSAVRLVRCTKEMKQERIGKFTVQNGIAEDTEVDLMWLRFSHGQTWQNGTAAGNATNVNWNKALEIAKQFNQQGGYAGYSDWRLPTIDELKSLIDRVKGKSGNFIDTDVFPNNAQWYWSSSPYAYRSNLAWIVDFNSGYGGDDYKDSYSAVRLVRGNTNDKPAGNQIHSAAKAR